MTTATQERVQPRLGSYYEKGASELLEKYGVFYAFGNEQFEKGMQEGTEIKDYVSLGYGGYCLRVNAMDYLQEREKLRKESLKKLKENHSKEEIIKYELSNHESYYQGEVDYNCMELLQSYGYTSEEVWEVFRNTRQAYYDNM